MSALERPRAKGNIVSGTQSVVRVGGEVRHEIRTAAPAIAVFAFLTNAEKMATWLAQDVRADPRSGGMFRLTDLSGLWIEGTYVEMSVPRRVAFTWGGIEGLKIGESTVEFSLQPDASGSVVRVRHFNLSRVALHMHRIGWENWGLPKLKAVAEGERPQGTYLGDFADSREQLPYGRHAFG